MNQKTLIKKTFQHLLPSFSALILTQHEFHVRFHTQQGKEEIHAKVRSIANRSFGGS